MFRTRMTLANSKQKSNVLLIEDDGVHARVVSRWLQAAGFDVTVASTANSAMGLLSSHHWSAIISDCDLPDGNGVEIARLAKLSLPRVPFILITSGNRAERVVLALRAGVDEMMLKMAPIKREQLVTRLVELIEEYNSAPQGLGVRQTILAIGAHPDDIELGCGGALLAHVQDGHQVILFTCSPQNNGEGDTLRHISQQSATILGAGLVTANLSEAEISDSGATLSLIQHAISKYQPSVVYTHSVNDLNPEHRSVARASLSASHSAATVVCYQSASATVDFRPTLFVDIEAHIEKKLLLLSGYEAASKADYLASDQIRANARYWSKYTATKGAEPFEVFRSCV
jgi:LmbE family N-acetylglucosaminyl deacetylase/ActR/RegA family two-component response regulator